MKADAVLATRPGYDLPTMKSRKDVPEQGWHLPTMVRPSSIPEAGNGRFATAHLRAKGTVFRKQLVPMVDVQSLSALANDVTISFSSIEDLEKYVELSQCEGGHRREDVLKQFEHCMYGFDGKRTCLNVSAWTVNHQDHLKDGLNMRIIEKVLPHGIEALVGEALVDIHVHDELFFDYRTFQLPEFYLAYAKRHGFKDVRSSTMEAVCGRHWATLLEPPDAEATPHDELSCFIKESAFAS